MKSLLYLITGSRRKRRASLRDRCLLFRWTVADSFRYLFIEDSPFNLVEVEDDLRRMQKMDRNSK